MIHIALYLEDLSIGEVRFAVRCRAGDAHGSIQHLCTPDVRVRVGKTLVILEIACKRLISHSRSDIVIDG